jgi:ankyrin repeat protein
LAAQNGNKKTLKALYNCEEITVLPTETDKKGWNVLHHAIDANIYDHSDFVISLITKYPEMANAKTIDGLNIWHFATANDCEKTWKAFYNCSEITVLPTETDDNGWNALHHAVVKGHSDLATNLIKRYPEMINIKTKAGKTILDLASAETKKILLDLSAVKTAFNIS